MGAGLPGAAPSLRTASMRPETPAPCAAPQGCLLDWQGQVAVPNGLSSPTWAASANGTATLADPSPPPADVAAALQQVQAELVANLSGIIDASRINYSYSWPPDTVGAGARVGWQQGGAALCRV